MNFWSPMRLLHKFVPDCFRQNLLYGPFDEIAKRPHIILGVARERFFSDHSLLMLKILTQNVK